MSQQHKTKKIVLAGVIFCTLLISSFFVTTFPPSPDLWPVSVIAICLFFIPVCIGIIQWLGLRSGLLLITVLGMYALVFESIAVISGVPYGHFQYSDVLGPKIAGIVPGVVFLAWTPLLLGLVGRFRHQSILITIVITTLLLVCVDAVLDPAAVGLKFWRWDEPGIYYGVSLINFAGWIVSGSIAVTVLEVLRRKYAWPPAPKLLGYTLIATIVFWGLVNMFLGQVVPVLLAGALAFVIWRLTTTRDGTL